MSHPQVPLASTRDCSGGEPGHDNLRVHPRHGGSEHATPLTPEGAEPLADALSTHL
ncbi:hypothetical protein [Nocardioides sp.]|uniref:hypothetical protein n=1 Tax=Nocardioides sp. TaxID=35761 RepID=UPI0031FEB505|nr:hypothetical protein [Nocardioides sp.]